jgi:RecJ-like exonuclease
MKTETCPTCHGTGVVAACATCGGQEICPTCHGTGIISVWVASSTGSTNDVGSMYNLRFQMDPNGNTFWGFAPTATVIQVEMGLVQYGSSIINMQLVKRYAGI